MSTTQSHGYMFEITIEILLFITCRTSKTYVQDIMDEVVSGVSARTVQRYLNSLQKHGYIQGDNQLPQGFVPTLKSKQTFGVGL
ncbi:hypothetical protein [Acinetobacter sp. Ver3]|uniref:hypothetical protein n=1 Tax=Acinetobacter sp. Ver3 TaxID=466088 RepID=UPI00044EF58A|nr:hypothetical protein [Acinetobacter sp. Ver3]EZQ12088.1 hypothetical protein CL42_02050 [Acinetobacter sp. Ver3]